MYCSMIMLQETKGSAVAWWLMPRTPDPEVGGSSPNQVKPCCALEQGTFTRDVTSNVEVHNCNVPDAVNVVNQRF